MQLLDTIVERLSEDPDWSEKDESSIMEPYTYIISHPGKDVRSQFIDAFNLWLNVPKEKTKSIAKIVNMLHTASLLIDDIQDNSQLRRGHPVAHKIYGVPQTINTANYVYFLAFREVKNLYCPSSEHEIRTLDLESIINAELLNLHRGQGLDLFWRDNLSCPTEKEYVDMVKNKTGGLLRIGVKLMMAMAKTNIDVDYVPLVNLIGVFFQIRDDLMNLSSTTYTSNKGFAEDLTEGKFSFPVVHGIRADGENRQILNVLQKKPATPTLKLHTVNYLKEHTKSFQYTLVVLATMETRIRMEITRLGGNEGLERLIDRLHVDPTTIQ
ncbi:terpenoid synthase [Dendrothele bispora CBS 962.96]|uniref:(2E,6E)-farnesyl diphosphate synthase n=1 Tax=Dendrothele bispora (strain CBS 962.96) TaxID=1314807 RepID=A0A4S8M7H1_DENBC|nr:terpenoid synthase [Dendrothele bispora CBS 962.96]